MSCSTGGDGNIGFDGHLAAQDGLLAPSLLGVEEDNSLGPPPLFAQAQVGSGVAPAAGLGPGAPMPVHTVPARSPAQPAALR